jgi:integrase
MASRHPNPKVTLRVKSRGGAPQIYARFRLDGRDAEPSLGKGWLVPVGSAQAKPNGKVLGEWAERRGRAPAGQLTLDRAWQRVPEVIATYDARAQEEARQRANDARLRFQDAVDRWLAARRVDDPNGEREAWKHSHASNMTDYARRFVRELGPERFVDTFTTVELRRWLAHDLKPMRNGVVLDRPTSRKMRATYSQALAGFFGYATAMGWMLEDPTAGLPAYRARRKRSDDPLRRDEYLTKAELAAALDRLRRPDPERVGKPGRHRHQRERDQDVAVIMVMAMAGLRPGEAIALLWEHVDFRAKVIRVLESRTMGVTDTPKSGSGRTVPMSGEIARVLHALRSRDVYLAPTDRVFVGLDGGHVDQASLGRRFAKAQMAASITPARELRQMRNTFGTVCAAEGVPLRTIQQWMGHASIITTEIYASFMPRERDAAVIEAAFA